jgi:transcriptional regulator with XRE-family HTH domain
LVSREPAFEDVPDDAAPLTPPNDLFLDIGRQLRRARLASGMSLREMARRVDVSASFISQMELGRANPSVATLYAIASELGVSLDGLMPPAQSQPGTELSAAESGGPAGPVPRVRRRTSQPFVMADADSPVQRADRRHELKVGGAIWGRLTADHDPANDFLHVTYKPGGESCPEDQMIHHRGFEYGYIISGRLRVQVGFADYELGEGDSISFASITPHRLSNPYSEISQSLWMVVGRGGTPVL